MPASAVRKTTLSVSSVFDFESDDQLDRTNIDSTTEKIFPRRLVHAWLLELICGSGFRPGQTLGGDLEHAGSKGLRFSTASKEKGRRPIFAQAHPRPKGGTASPPETRPYPSRVQKSKVQGWGSLLMFVMSRVALPAK
jgi:hypothetical protein